MSNQTTQTTQIAEASQTKPQPNSPTVTIAIGAGNKPIQVAWQSGDTVASVLKRAEIVVERGKTPTLGKKRITKPGKTPVQPGDVIVVAGMPANG